MPVRNSVKIYVDEGIYHIYNRGVEKRIIFLDDQDYKVFLHLLKDALSPPIDVLQLAKEVTFKGLTFKGVPRQPKNFYGKIILLAYALMPNHFHLLVQQISASVMKEFMQSIMTRYVFFFNKKYERVGALFQGRYKAALVSEEPYLIHLSRYIHRNPSELVDVLTDGISSYADYLHLRNASWVKPDLILSFFKKGSLVSSKHNTYRAFVEDDDIESEVFLEDLMLDGSTL